MGELETLELLNLDETIAKDLFREIKYPWEILPKIKEYIIILGETLDPNIYDLVDDNIWIAKNAKINPNADIYGPVIIDENAELRNCVSIRGGVIIGKKSVIGNNCELKNCIIFNEAEIPHFNYVGDSIIGYKAHIGAGVVTANQKCDKSPVTISYNDIKHDTTLQKMGTILGDNVEVGCNSVLNPGSVVGRNSIIYPLVSIRGYISKDSIVKAKDNIEIKK